MNLSSLLLGSWSLLAGQVPALPEDVEWSVPPGCPDRAALLEGVAQRRGAPPGHGQVRVVGRMRATGARRYRLELELAVGDRRESRVLSARTCAALVDAAALVIAHVLDASSPAAEAPLEVEGDEAPPMAEEPPPVVPPVAMAGEPAPVVSPVAVVEEPAAAPAPPSAVAELEVPVAAPPVPERARRTPGGFLRVHGLGEIGALPGPTAGVGLAGGLLWRRVRVELQVGYLAPRSVMRSDVAREVRASLVMAAALGCARPGRGNLEVPVCVGLEAGGLPGAAEGPGGRVTATGRWLAGTAGVGAALRVHPRVALWAFLAGLAAFQRGSFVLRGPGGDVTLFDPGIGSARLALGVEVRFGDRQ